ncbi:hypothetical protein D3C81_2314800 [compost metagenome]
MNIKNPLVIPTGGMIIFLIVTGLLLALSRMNIVSRAIIKVPAVAAICRYVGLSCINSGPFQK